MKDPFKPKVTIDPSLGKATKAEMEILMNAPISSTGSLIKKQLKEQIKARGTVRTRRQKPLTNYMFDQ